MRQRIKLLVRKNLKMSPGKIAAQCVHAALGLNEMYENKSYCYDVLGPELSVVVLEVSDAKFQEAKLVSRAGPYYLVQDAGFTEVAPNTETVLAFLEPDPRNT